MWFISLEKYFYFSSCFINSPCHFPICSRIPRLCCFSAAFFQVCRFCLVGAGSDSPKIARTQWPSVGLGIRMNFFPNRSLSFCIRSFRKHHVWWQSWTPSSPDGGSVYHPRQWPRTGVCPRIFGRPKPDPPVPGQCWRPGRIAGKVFVCTLRKSCFSISVRLYFTFFYL